MKTLVPTLLICLGSMSAPLQLSAEDSTPTEVPSTENETTATTNDDPFATETAEDPFATNTEGESDTEEDPFALPEDPRAIIAKRKKSSASSPFSLYGRLRAGADSNVSLESDALNSTSDADSSVIDAYLSARYRFSLADSVRLDTQAFINQNTYADKEDYNLTSIGASAGLQWTLDKQTFGLLGEASHFRLDNEDVVDVLTVGARYANLFTSNRVFVASLDVQALDYTDNNDMDGTLVSLRINRWKLLDTSNARKRLEWGARFGHYQAEKDVFSYDSVRLESRLLYPFLISGKKLETSIAGQVEGRFYKEATVTGGESEQQLILRSQASADFWFMDKLAAGIYGSWSDRSSNLDNRDYDRFQFGIQLQGKW